MNEVLIFSTDPKSNKGGIASSVSAFLMCLGSKSVKTKLFITHSPDAGRLKNSVIFLFALVKLICDLSLKSLSGQHAVSVYLHVGPKGSLLRKIIISEICSAFRVKVYTQHHSPAFDEYLRGQGFFSKALIRLSSKSHKNLVLSDWWKLRYSRRGIYNVEVVPNSISTSCMPRALEQKKPHDSQPVILSVGRMVKGKNFDLLINSIGQVKVGARLKVAGGGPELEKLKGTADGLKLAGSVDFLGWVDLSQKTELYKSSNLFALPSSYDSFGMVYIEALAHGCPVVIGPNPAVISALKGLDGVFVAEDYSPLAVARAINLALSASIDRSEISKSCLSRYGIKSVGETLFAALELTDE